MYHTLRALLSTHGAAFEALPDCGAARHLPGTLVAKVVVVRDPNNAWFAVAVLPAGSRLDLDIFRELTGRPDVRPAHETEFAEVFSEYEVDVIPPFGQIYGGLPLYVDDTLARATHIVFEAGSQVGAIRMPTAEYLRLDRPVIVRLGSRAPGGSPSPGPLDSPQ